MSAPSPHPFHPSNECRGLAIVSFRNARARSGGISGTMALFSGKNTGNNAAAADSSSLNVYPWRCKTELTSTGCPDILRWTSRSVASDTGPTSARSNTRIFVRTPSFRPKTRLCRSRKTNDPTTVKKTFFSENLFLGAFCGVALNSVIEGRHRLSISLFELNDCNSPIISLFSYVFNTCLCIPITYLILNKGYDFILFVR